MSDFVVFDAPLGMPKAKENRRKRPQLRWTKEQKQLMHDALWRAWSAIGHDVEDAWRTSPVPRRSQNTIAVEVCFDFLDMYGGAYGDEKEGGKKAHELLRQRIDATSYHAALAYCCRLIRLE